MTYQKPKTPVSRRAGSVLKVTGPTGLLEFLLARLKDQGRSKVKSLLAHRNVRVDGAIVTQFDHPLRPGQKVTIGRSRAAGETLPQGLKIVYEDQWLIVIDKPAGLLSIATETEKDKTAYHILSRRVKKETARNKVFIVHRLDREASGLMMFARDRKTKETLQNDWKTLVPERTYAAVVEGSVEKVAGTIKSLIRENEALTVYSTPGGGEAKRAITHFRVLKRSAGFSLLSIELDTGRKNQIRVHMKEMGHSIIGDKKYGAIKNPIKRLGLHAHKLGFTHPITKTYYSFSSPIPGSFFGLF